MRCSNALPNGRGSLLKTTYRGRPSVPTLSAEKLTAFAKSLFLAAGVPAEEADRVAQSLVLANLCGHDSHGMIRIVQYADAIKDGRLKPGAPFNIVKQTAAVLVVDGGWGLGM